MTAFLLLEIGTEEIPASYQEPALNQLGQGFEKWVADRGLPPVEVETWATPRRLTLKAGPLPDKEPDREEITWGPPVKVAFDQDGKPTVAAVKFAESQGVKPDSLGREERGGKGVYLCCRKKVVGQPLKVILGPFLKELVTAVSFPKSMRWGSKAIRFARPIHWVVALLGDEVVPFELEGVKAGRDSRGHRFMEPGPISIPRPGKYDSLLEKAKVIVDPARRRKIIVEGAKKLAAAVDGQPLLKEELIAEVVNLVEFPVPLRGKFDSEFLSLPREVLTTTMIHHQKFFPVFDSSDKPLPFFIGVSNQDVSEPEIVVKGYERVLRARLADAGFFYEEDRSKPLSDRVEALKEVVFHHKLGTSYQKMTRFRALAVWLARQCCPDKADSVDRGALLAKADLETAMVYEFPELQGIMGRVYAIEDGEDKEVAVGIEEHYLPRFAGDILPSTDVGAVVSIADRADTLVGSFGIGQIPTGSEDPYALRRHALAMIQIVQDKGYHFSLAELLSEAGRSYDGMLKKDSEETAAQVTDFLYQRFRHWYRSKGIRPDLVEAILAAGIDDIAGVEERMTAGLKSAESAELFEAAVAFKRVANITADHPAGKIREDRLTHSTERELYDFHLRKKEEIIAAASAREYEAVFAMMIEYRQPVDRFFEDVLVMDPDPGIRENRLNLLKDLAVLLGAYIDFSQLQEPSKEGN